jgi:hypothetical protein
LGVDKPTAIKELEVGGPEPRHSYARDKRTLTGDGVFRLARVFIAGIEDTRSASKGRLRRLLIEEGVQGPNLVE